MITVKIEPMTPELGPLAISTKSPVEVTGIDPTTPPCRTKRP